MIAGGLAGGATAETPSAWVEGYLRDLLDAPYSGEPDTDALGAASLVKVASSDQQQGTAGALLALPAAVVVRDSQGRPVAGAAVTFTTNSVGTLVDPATHAESGTVTVLSDPL